MQISLTQTMIMKATAWLMTCLFASCHVTKAQFEKYKSEQSELHRVFERELKNINIELRCKDDTVRDFIKDCVGNGMNCLEKDMTKIMEKMSEFKHVMMRLKFVENETPQLDPHQMSALSQLFSRMRKSSQVLLVAIPGHKSREPQVKQKIKSSKGTDPSSQSGYAPFMKPDKLYDALHNLQDVLRNEPYKLSGNATKSLEPQVPSCDSKSDNIISSFRKKNDNKNELTDNEKALKTDYFDLIVFLVDCQ